MSHQQTEMSSKSFEAFPREKLCHVLMNEEHNSGFNFTKIAESGWLTPQNLSHLGNMVSRGQSLVPQQHYEPPESKSVCLLPFKQGVC